MKERVGFYEKEGCASLYWGIGTQINEDQTVKISVLWDDDRNGKNSRGFIFICQGFCKKKTSFS